MATASRPAIMDILEPRLLLSAVTVMSEDFESDFPGTNWTTNVSQSRYWNDVSSIAHSGNWSGFSAASSTNLSGYADNQDTYMQRTVDLRGVTSASLSFYYEMYTNVSDFFTVRVNGSPVFTQSGNHANWTQATVDLSDWAGQNNVTIKFEFASGATAFSNLLQAPYVDDIVLTGDTTDGNDQISEATELASPHTDAIRWPIDVDMFAVTVTAGQSIGFDVDGDFDSYLRLFYSSGTQLASNDNQAAPGETSGTDPYLEYTFTTAGTYYVGISGAGNIGYNATTGDGDSLGATGNYTLTLTTVDDDPNDNFIYAVNLGVPNGTPNSAYSIAPETDVDMFSFTATAGTRLGFDIDLPVASNLDSIIRLFNSSGTELAINDDHAGPGEVQFQSHESYLEYTFSADGTYYLGVSGYNNAGYDPVFGTGDVAATSVGAFTLTVTPVDLDPDDITVLATPLLPDTPTTGAIDTSTDVDMYSFNISTPGRRIYFDIDSAGAGFDTYFRLFNAAGVQLAGSNNAPAPGEAPTHDSYLEYTFPAAGTYYLGVSGNGNTAYNALYGTGEVASTAQGSYTLVAGEDTDPDDRIVAPNAATVNSTITGQTIDAATDVDLFAVTVTAGQKIAFDIDRPSGTLDSFIRLFNSAGTKLASSNNAPAPGETASTDSYLEYTFTTGGTYYLGVSSASNSAYNATTGLGDAGGSTTGAYTLVITAIVNDPDDVIAEATPIAVGASATGKAIDVATDVDLFSVTVSAGQRLCFDIDRPSGSLDSFIRLFNASGTQLAGSNNAPAPGEAASTDSYLEYTFATAGKYYLGVSGNGNSAYSIVSGAGDSVGSTGAYTLVVTADSDPDDTIASAIQTTVNSTNSGRLIDTTTDVDLYAFTVTAGHKIAFDIDKPSGTLDSYIRLFNSSGTQLAGSNNAPAPGEAASHDSYLEYTFATAGTYYLGVSGATNNAYSIVSGTGDTASLTTGAYTLIITDITQVSV